MRPKERLLRIETPANEIRKKLEEWSDRLSVWEHGFTATVVVGLLIEYLPLITYFFPRSWALAIRPHAEQLSQFGGLLVIIGVAGELWIGNRSSRVETDLREETNSEIATVHERAANAERAAAEANLARVKIEQRMSPRVLFATDEQALRDLLTPHAQMSVDIVVFDHHMEETIRFADQITGIFASVKWRLVRQWESRNATFRIPGPSLLIALGVGHVTKESLDLAEKLTGILGALGIDSGINPNSFGCGGEFNPGDFALKIEQPLTIFGGRNVAPFRIQIGAKQLSPVPSPKIVMVTRSSGHSPTK